MRRPQPNYHSPRPTIVVVGDHSSGKTSLLTRFRYDTFQTDIYVSVTEPITLPIDVDGSPVDFDLVDTMSQSCCDGLPALLGIPPSAEVALLCFSMDSPDGLDNIQEKWLGEITRFAKNAKLFVVGCKSDLKDDPNVVQRLRSWHLDPISSEQAFTVANDINALKYLECSAKTGEGVDDVFTLAARAALASRMQGDDDGSRCTIT